MLYQDYAYLDVLDRERPGAFLAYGWRDGELQGPESTDVIAGPADLAAEAFRLSAVAFDVGLFLLVTGALVMLLHRLARLVAGRNT